MEDQATKIREYLNNFIPQLKDFVKSIFPNERK